MEKSDGNAHLCAVSWLSETKIFHSDYHHKNGLFLP
jgi:hypothetical protein